MTQQGIPWYYVYSDRYEAFHYMFQSQIQTSGFELKPLYVEQSTFDQVTYREGLYHFLCGCFIKQEFMYKLVHELPEDSYFLFTDVDYIITDEAKLHRYISRLMERKVELAFQYEPQRREVSQFDINVGFCLIRVCANTRAYFTEVMRRAENETVKNDLDIMASVLETYPGRFKTIRKDIICMPNLLDTLENRDNLMAIPILCDMSTDYKENLKSKYESAKSYGLPMQAYISMALANGRTPEELGLA